MCFYEFAIMRQKSNDDCPKEVFNRPLFLCVAAFGLFGISRGLDEATYSGCVTQPSFTSQFNMNSASRTANEIADLKSTILSMVILGSICGAVVGFAVNDKLGRIKSLYISLFFWAFGVILQVCPLTDNIAQLCSGRFIAGIGIGMSVVVGPTYLVEISPSSIRGLCTCIFSTATYIGIMLG